MQVDYSERHLNTDKRAAMYALQWLCRPIPPMTNLSMESRHPQAVYSYWLNNAHMCSAAHTPYQAISCLWKIKAATMMQHAQVPIVLSQSPHSAALSDALSSMQGPRYACLLNSCFEAGLHALGGMHLIDEAPPTATSQAVQKHISWSGLLIRRICACTLTNDMHMGLFGP